MSEHVGERETLQEMVPPSSREQLPSQGKKSTEQTIDWSAPLWKTMLFFLIPLMLSNALQSISGTVSAILLGRGLGEHALAATSAVFPIVFFLVSFVIGLGSASSVLIGQAYGAGQTERMKATVGTSLSVSFLLGIVTMGIGIFFTRELFTLIGTPESIIHLSMDYARVIFFGMPLMFLYINYTTFIRGTGDSKTPFYFLLLSTIFSIVLTPIFMFGWVGLPRLGVEGAAIANVTATLFTFIIFIIFLSKTRHPLALDKATLRHLRPDAQIVRLIVKIGLPTSIQMIFVSLSEIAVIAFVNAYGAVATAAYGAVIQVINYAHIPMMSLGIAVGIFGAQLIGANKQERLGELVKTTVTMNYVIGGILVGVVLLFSQPILSWFLVEPDTLEIAQELLFIGLWAFVVLGNSIILSGVMRSSGTVLWPTLISIFSIWGIQVPCAYFLSNWIGLKGVWYAYPIAFIISVALQYTYYRLFWRGKTHQQFFDPANR